MTSEHSVAPPASLLLAWWGTAWLRGLVPTDDVIDVMAEHAGIHSVREHVAPAPTGGVSPRPQVEGTGLVPLLAVVRRADAREIGATFPVEGDPLGLGGPRDFNLDATEAGEALLCPAAGLGVVPHTVGAGTTWTVHEARPRPLPDVGEADRGLRAGLLAALGTMERLDVASWSPDATDELLNLRRPPDLSPAPGTPAPVLDLAERALRARRVTELALRDHGGALSATEVMARAGAVGELDRWARAALAAASSPWCWPPEARSVATPAPGRG